MSMVACVYFSLSRFYLFSLFYEPFDVFTLTASLRTPHSVLLVTEVSVFELHVSLVGVIDRSHVTEAMVARFTADKQTQWSLQRLPCYLPAAS